QYTYTFTGWDRPLAAVTGDEEYTARFDASVNSYTVLFKNDDGSVLETKSVPYGETPAYTGDEPVKAATAQYTYTFTGWDRPLAAVTGDEEYTARFDASVNSYTVLFKNADGGVLERQSVEYDTTPVYGGVTPTKSPTINQVFAFSGWNAPIVPVTGDAEYTAVFSAADRVWEYDTYTDVAYGTASSSQKMDICVPRGIGAYDNVGYLFYVHSGAWTGGTRAEAYSLCTEYAAKGYVTSTMDYRLLGENSTISAHTMINDIYDAMTKAKSLLDGAGVHVGKVVMYGYSAGAHLAMLYTTTQSANSPYPIAFAVDRAGPADMDIAKWTHLMQSYNMGFNTTELKEYIGQLAGNKSAFTGVTDQQLLLEPYQNYLRGFTDVISPAKHVSASTPPAILCYGGKEVLVLTDQRDAIANAYRNAGAAYTLIEYPNSYHGLESDPASEAQFRQTLKQYFTTYIGY
ncbi:MAG: alpha/beta hydrolase fold domain-containing protein, partial [Clostridia bacterium]|nr:alpha/beta hydrolase fold domain-containing protein [Clostridia bacterium]